jgi:hypothetical protein
VDDSSERWVKLSLGAATITSGPVSRNIHKLPLVDHYRGGLLETMT